MSDVRKGKTLSEEHKNKISESKAKEWNIIDPNGSQTNIKDLSQYCRNNNLDYSTMIKVAKGKYKHHKGYKCYYCASS